MVRSNLPVQRAAQLVSRRLGGLVVLVGLKVVAPGRNTGWDQREV